MNIYFTANQQFGRKGAIKAYQRPFSTTEEMNQHLIDNWNSTVGVDDIIFVLGNLAWDPETAEEVMHTLHGNIILIPGEWDGAIQDLIDVVDTDINVVENSIKLEENLKLCMSYWPLETWPNREIGWSSIIGHPGKSFKTDHKINRINVSCDYWDYKPVQVNRVLKLFEELKTEV